MLSLRPAPSIEPLKVGTLAASVKVSATAPPTKASTEVMLMPEVVTAFAAVMLKALAVARPVRVSVLVPPVRVVIALKTVPFKVPAVGPVTTHALVPSVAAKVLVPACLLYTSDAADDLL